MPADKANPITSSVSPDLDAVARFIRDMLARGAIAELIAAVLALLVRMRDLNTELVARIAAKSRKRPPSEKLRRLQLELPGVFAASANDNAPRPPPKKKKKRGPKRRHKHGRPKLPAHLPRVPDVQPVPDDKRQCAVCGNQAGSDREKARRFDRAERGRAQRRVATRESQRQGRSLRSRRTRPAARVPDPGLRALQKALMVRMDAGLSWSGRASDVQPAGNPQEVLGDPADCRARARSRRSYGRVSQRSLPFSPTCRGTPMGRCR